MGCSNLLWGVTHRGMGSKNGHFGRYVIIEWSQRSPFSAERQQDSEQMNFLFRTRVRVRG